MKPYCILPCLLFALVFSGCTGSNLPEGWPKKVVPCSVTVTKGGRPIDGATVFLISTSTGGNWTVSGKTDAQGVAEIYTTCSATSKSGAPVGDFKVIISKANPPVAETVPKAVLDAMGYEERKAHDEKRAAERAKQAPLVPTALTQNGTTPLTISVQEKGELTVDLDDYN